MSKYIQIPFKMNGTLYLKYRRCYESRMFIRPLDEGHDWKLPIYYRRYIIDDEEYALAYNKDADEAIISDRKFIRDARKKKKGPISLNAYGNCKNTWIYERFGKTRCNNL